MLRVFLTTTILTLAPAFGGAAEEKVDFTRDIRPILSNTCFKCHGPDENERKAGLRLDTREGALDAIEPGNLDDSELYHRLTTDDPDDRMPPVDSGLELTAEQVELFRRWIEQGAEWGTHWAFVAPNRPEIPRVKNPAWVQTPIDAFVLARLEREGLQPSPPADKARALRRLSFDLIGLPPTLEELDAFLADDRPEAWSDQVERLLASPHYGEKWGREWLDAARYADSDGYEKDKPRFVWFYRDWVIDALNRDLPYDRFIVEQIAGDLLPGAKQDQLVATGFLRNSMINEEGGIDPEQFRMEAMFDRMDAIGKAVLGLTVQCSQCHTHKYDPLTQEEYYGLFAFINNAHEANVTVYTDEEQEVRESIFAGIRRIERGLKDSTPDWEQRLAQWENQASQPHGKWTTLDGFEVEDDFAGGQKYIPQGEGVYLVQGYAPTLFKPLLSVHTDVKKITGFRLELLTDPNLPRGGPGRSIQGTAALSEFEVEYAHTDAPDKKTKVKFVRASANLNAPEKPLNKEIYKEFGKKDRVTGPVEFAIDGKPETAWTTDAGPGQRNQPWEAVFVPESPIELPNGGTLHFWLEQKHGGPNSDDNQNHNIGSFRLSITDAPEPEANPVPARIRDILTIAPEKRTQEQRDAMFSFWRTTVPEWRSANDEIEKLWASHPEGATQLVLLERDEVRETRLLERGDFLKPVDKVAPKIPAFLHAWPGGAPRNRLGFAQWLVDRKSPTTARAIVNRIWQSYFGIGIVETSEDLGSQAAAPSHPQLLDFLAVELMDNGWSLKHVHQLIVNSATYRQTSKVSGDLYARDPYNRLQARGPRFRLDAELVRDTALAAAGLLNLELGGPPVYPPAPDFLFQPPASYGPKNWYTDTGDDRYRRAIYTFRFRSVPYPALETFDAPKGDFACVRRVRSNTPLQALTTLNETLFMEAARAMAMRIVTEGGASDDARLGFAFRVCLSRTPAETESATLLAMLNKQTSRFEGDPSGTWALAANDPDNPPTLPEGVTPAQLAAWTAVARVLLNLDETITKE